MITRQSLHTTFNIKKDEEQPVLLLLAYSFFSGISIYIFYIVANALFLVNYSKAMLPVAYIAGGVLLFFIGKINVSFQTKVNFTKLSVALIIFQFISVAVMLYFYETFSWKGITLIMFIWNRISVYVSNVTFWTSSSKIFNLEQAKRIFSLIATGDVVASIISYFTVNVLLSAKVLHTEELLYISLAALVVSLGIMIVIIKKYDNKLSTKPKESDVRPVQEVELDGAAEVKKGWIFSKIKFAKPDFFASSPDDSPSKKNYKHLVFLLGMVPVLGVYFAEFIFSVEVKNQFPAKDQLTVFLGQFFFISAIIELLVKVFFYRFTIRTFGLISGIILLPVALILVFVFAITISSFDLSVFFFILLSRFLCISVKKSFSDTSFQILYQPLEKQESMALQNKVEIYAKPLGYISAGVILLLLVSINLGAPIYIMCAFLVILIGWAIASFRMQTEYQNMLSSLFTLPTSTINRTSPSEQNSKLNPKNLEDDGRISFESIVGKSLSDNLPEVLEGLTMLGRSKRFLSFKYLLPHLQSTNTIIKKAAIIAAGENGNPELWNSLFENLCNKKYYRETRLAIIKTGDRIIPALDTYFNLSKEDVEVQLSCIEIIFTIGGDRAIRSLRQKLNDPVQCVKDKVYESLAAMGYGVNLLERANLVPEVRLHIGFTIWIIAAQRDLFSTLPVDSSLGPELVKEYNRAILKLLNVLTLLTKDNRLFVVQKSISSRNENTKSYLLEILNIAIPAEHKPQVIPLFEDISISEKILRYKNLYPQQRMSVQERLYDIINKDFSRLNVATKIAAIKQLEDYPSEETTFILSATAVSSSEILSETAMEILLVTDFKAFTALARTMIWKKDDFHCKIGNRLESSVFKSFSNPAL